MKIVCKLSSKDIILDDVVKDLAAASTGAVAAFTGLVRGITERSDPHKTIKLEYEAYEPMAVKMMHQIVHEIEDRWNMIEAVTMIQRVGTLYPGEIAVVVACSASHRDTGVFDAASYGIERLKEIVPVWKKEFGPTGEVWVEGDHIPPSQ